MIVPLKALKAEAKIRREPEQCYKIEIASKALMSLIVEAVRKENGKSGQESQAKQVVKHMR